MQVALRVCGRARRRGGGATVTAQDIHEQQMMVMSSPLSDVLAKVFYQKLLFSVARGLIGRARRAVTAVAVVTGGRACACADGGAAAAGCTCVRAAGETHWRGCSWC